MNGNSWDKILLVGLAVVVIGLSGLFITKALGFGELFGLVEVTPNDEMPETDVATVAIAKDFVETENTWENPKMGEKPIPLFVSVPIVESDGVLIDMLDPNAPKLRPPVTNAWLIANNLDYLNSSVLQQDPDDDGFSNLAEWEAKTDPIDPDAHPPYAEKLVMHSRQQEEYRLVFSARPDPERVQIRRVPTAKWPRPDNFLLKIGDTSDDEQFRVDGVEAKEAQRGGITVDASIAKITYLPKGTQHELVKGVEELMPTYFAELEFLLEPGKKFYVKEGDAFNLVLDPETKYRVTKADENSTTITYQTGTAPEVSLEIPKK